MKDFQLLIYSTPSEDIKVDVILKGEDIWAHLRQHQVGNRIRKEK